MRDSCIRLIAPAVALAAMATAIARADGPLDALDTFQHGLSPAVAAQLGMPPKHYRQIEPSLYYLAAAHAARIEPMTRAEQVKTLVALARFIDARRDAMGERIVIGTGRDVIGLLDPDRGLDPKEITTISRAYAASPTIFKRAAEGDTIESVADAFLAAVARAASGTTPTTIVVLGHGLPDQIQSYSISCDRLAEALVPKADTAADAAVDLGHVVLICDDCYSADFSINLAAAIERRCRDCSRSLASLPVMIAGTNRNCVGHADFGAAFVPHFWKDVIELYYVRRPRQAAITLRDFFDKVDGMMYGYGRATSVGADGTVSYRLVDPKLCQDPVVFVPLDETDLDELRAILGLPADAPLPRLLDIG
ncbi:MAG: hypothetical protein ACKOEX_04395 [Planctomycetia bacterium]